MSLNKAKFPKKKFILTDLDSFLTQKRNIFLIPIPLSFFSLLKTKEKRGIHVCFPKPDLDNRQHLQQQQYVMEEKSSFLFFLSRISPLNLNVFRHYCHNVNPFKMFFTIIIIFLLSSIFRFFRRHGLSCLNPRKFIASKKLNYYIDYFTMQLRGWLCKSFFRLEMAIGACNGVSPFSFRRKKFSALMEVFLHISLHNAYS